MKIILCEGWRKVHPELVENNKYLIKEHYLVLCRTVCLVSIKKKSYCRNVYIVPLTITETRERGPIYFSYVVTIFIQVVGFQKRLICVIMSQKVSRSTLVTHH